MKYKITTLIENNKNDEDDFKVEHGLSFIINTPFGSIIFDTGQSGLFYSNAEAMGVNFEDLSKVVISHGHYDHSGGFTTLIEKGKKDFDLIVSKHFFQKKYKLGDGVEKYIGNKFDYDYLVEHNIKLDILDEDTKMIFPDVFAVGNFERFFNESTEEIFLVNDHKDLFDDEISLVVNGEKGLIILVGCSHPGIRNIVKTISERFKKPIYAIIGGTHLRNASKERIVETSNYFKSLNIEKIGVSHCTGEKAVEIFKSHYKENFFENKTGTIFEFN